MNDIATTAVTTGRVRIVVVDGGATVGRVLCVGDPVPSFASTILRVCAAPEIYDLPPPPIRRRVPQPATVFRAPPPRLPIVVRRVQVTRGSSCAQHRQSRRRVLAVRYGNERRAG